MKFTTETVVAALTAVLIPFCVSQVVMYSEIQVLKSAKADIVEVKELKADVGKQIALNTQAIDNLNTTLSDLLVSIREWKSQLRMRRVDNGQEQF